MQKLYIFKSKQNVYFLAFVFLLASCHPDNENPNPYNIYTKDARYYDNSVALQWNNLLLDISRYAPGFRPPVQARALGYIGLAVYESVVPGMPRYNSLGSQFNGLNLPQAQPAALYNWPTCAGAAYSTIIRAFYPNLPQAQLDKITALETQLKQEAQSKLPNDIYDLSVKFGTDVANAVYTWSATDVIGHEAYKHNTDPNYKPPTGIGKWQPTKPDFSAALLPYWGNVRCFSIAPTDKLAKPPVAYSENKNSEFYKQAKEVYDLSNNPTYEHKWIAEFWSDDNFQLTLDPSTRWISIANQILNNKNATLETSVYTYAKVGLALADAGISCWFTKYQYNLIRPVDYINKVIDPKYATILNNPLINRSGYTPPFPAYVSGHATFGAAAAKAMASIFGNNTPFADYTHNGRTEFIGRFRTFETITQSSDENAISRLYLGVHYRMDAQVGVSHGYEIADKVCALPWLKKVL